MIERSPDRVRWSTAFTLGLGGLVAGSCGGGEPDAAPPPPARAVTVVELSTTHPSLDRLVPGTVAPYRRSDLGFEVSGRLEMVVDVGTEVSGPIGDGEVVARGDVLARLDPERYEQQLRQAELQLRSAKLGLQAQEVELDSVVTAQLQSAEAQAEASALEVEAAKDDVSVAGAAESYARTNLARLEQASSTRAVSESEVQAARSEFESATARLQQARTGVTAKEQAVLAARAKVAEVEGAALLKRARLDETRATIASLEESVARAERDLEDCVLRAPFNGRVTAVHLSEGALASPGAPIVTLTLFNPIQVEVTVSADVDRQLFVGAPALVFPFSDGRPSSLEGGLPATVLERGGVADAATRTFRAGLITRNVPRRISSAPEGTPEAPGVAPVVGDLQLAEARGRLFVLEDCLLVEEGRTTVLRVAGDGQRLRSSELTGELTPDEVAVELGPGQLEIIGWTLREVVGDTSLEPGDLLVEGPRPEHRGGVAIAFREWALRPGDVVWAALDVGDAPEGLYVPVQAISERNGATSVFVVDGGVAREVPVTVGPGDGELRPIEGADIRPGTRVVLGGAHFLLDGDRITVVER